MVRQCAWCGLILGDVVPFDNEGVTHGICVPCAEFVLEDSEGDRAEDQQQPALELPSLRPAGQRSTRQRQCEALRREGN